MPLPSWHDVAVAPVSAGAGRVPDLLHGVSGGDAIAVAVGLAHVVEGQDTPAGIVALPINEADGHAAANLAVVREQGVEQGPDLP